MLKIDELKVSYGGIEAVKGITFEVPERKIVTLIGANGAGKSTTLRTIAGLVKPAHGRIHLQGEDITALSPDRIVSKGITLVPEGRHVFPDLTVLENLKIGAYLRRDIFPVCIRTWQNVLYRIFIIMEWFQLQCLKSRFI